MLAGGFGTLATVAARAAELQTAAAPALAPMAADPMGGAVPAWFARDVARRARWLPPGIKDVGIVAAYRRRWETLPEDVRAILTEMAIPTWMVALIPTTPVRQHEIMKQFRFMAQLAGAPAESKLARRAEQLLIFGGAAQLPTPGDRNSGECLGAEGCTAAISKYILAQLKLEYPAELAGMSEALTDCQSSAELKAACQEAARAGLMTVARRPFDQLRAADVQPGSLTIAEKPGGTHVFGWTRVPAGWHWSPADKMAIGNTGLAQYGDRMILAQEYISGDAMESIASPHNFHGPINSQNVVYVAGEPDLADPHTNVYAARGSAFILVSLN